MSEPSDDLAWIEARERGEGGEHPRAAVYARLGAAIAELPEIAASDDGWQRAVLDELDRDAAQRVRVRTALDRRRAVVSVVIGALAIAALGLLILRPDPPPPVEPDLAYLAGRGAELRRTEGTVAVGTPLAITARVPFSGALWIYRGERLVLRCPGGDGCTVRSLPGGLALSAEVLTDAALTYTALLVVGAVPPPTGVLATDADAALGAIRETLTIDVH